MKKFGLVVAAIVAAGIAVPSIASAETIIVKHGDRGARAEMRGHDHGYRHHDRGFRHHDRKVMIIKRGGHHHHD
ncbi:hypothetical protein [Tardiphaga sp.]|uniref:hypothetical protein n=1 Tax=Tardiphaga sp. TaxID=1926292 RepID=UPI002602731D|nr:hypothetical protein [Tardiphaga sp.]MDB5619469.1 hypothetical protein [Tardiphaga sp.]